MNVTEKRVKEALALIGKARVIKLVKDSQAQTFVPAQVQYEVGCDEYTFEKDHRGTWRWGSMTTYGNYQFINGPGCDASGYVIKGAAARKLDKIVAG